MHLDLKPENLLLTTLCLKIADGLSRVTDPKSKAPSQRHHLQLPGPRSSWFTGDFAFTVVRRIYGWELLDTDHRRLLDGRDPKTCFRGSSVWAALTSMHTQYIHRAGVLGIHGAQAANLHALSSLRRHENRPTPYEFIRAMLEPEPLRRLSAADLLRMPFVKFGRVQYHSTLCHCCPHIGPMQMPAEQASPLLEPNMDPPANYQLIEWTTTTSAVRQLQHQLKHRMNELAIQPTALPQGLAINPLSPSFPEFQRAEAEWKARRRARAAASHAP